MILIRLICNILRLILILSLFLGGIYILTLQIPFWSLLLGIPATQLGIYLIIILFDELGHTAVTKEIDSLRQSFQDYGKTNDQHEEVDLGRE